MKILVLSYKLNSLKKMINFSKVSGLEMNSMASFKSRNRLCLL